MKKDIKEIIMDGVVRDVVDENYCEHRPDAVCSESDMHKLATIGGEFCDNEKSSKLSLSEIRSRMSQALDIIARYKKIKKPTLKVTELKRPEYGCVTLGYSEYNNSVHLTFYDKKIREKVLGKTLTNNMMLAYYDTLIHESIHIEQMANLKDMMLEQPVYESVVVPNMSEIFTIADLDYSIENKKAPNILDFKYDIYKPWEIQTRANVVDDLITLHARMPDAEQQRILRYYMKDRVNNTIVRIACTGDNTNEMIDKKTREYKNYWVRTWGGTKEGAKLLSEMTDKRIDKYCADAKAHNSRLGKIFG